MIWNPLSTIGGGSKSFLGIDVGTSSVKVVEISGNVKKPSLMSYGELKTYGYLRRLREPLQSSSIATLDSDIAAMIRQILEAAEAKTRRASMSIPLFSSFFTMLELPPMSREELQEAIPYQARQIVPIPLSEVILDWEIIARAGNVGAGGMAPQEKILVLLVAVPREVVDRYVRIAKLAAIELDGLEVEAFSLARAAFRNERRMAAIVDIGARSTNLIIAEDGSIRMSRSIDTAGSELTSAISRSMGIEVGRAEAMKISQGMSDAASPEVRRMLSTVIDAIVNETSKLMATYRRRFGISVEEVLLAGGTAGTLGLPEYFAKHLDIPVSRIVPFRWLGYPEALSPVLEEIGPSFAVAVGLALRRFVPAPARS